MKKVLAPARQLASLLLLNNKALQEPCLFRGRGDIAFVISFTEYVQYLTTFIVPNDIQGSYCSAKVYAYLIESNDTAALQRTMYGDIAIGAAKEWFYSEQLSSLNTAKLEMFVDGATYQDIPMITDAQFKESGSYLLDLLGKHGFIRNSKQVSPALYEHWKYAICCLTTARDTSIPLWMKKF